jgi:hypothetical protein
MRYGKTELIQTITTWNFVSGGGGYILGFTEDLERQKHRWKIINWSRLSVLTTDCLRKIAESYFNCKKTF